MTTKKNAISAIDEVVSEFWTSEVPDDTRKALLTDVTSEKHKQGIQTMFDQQNKSLAFNSFILNAPLGMTHYGNREALNELMNTGVYISDYCFLSKGKMFKSIGLPKYLFSPPRPKIIGKNATLEIVQIINFSWRLISSSSVRPPPEYISSGLLLLKTLVGIKPGVTISIENAKKIMKYILDHFPGLMIAYTEHRAQMLDYNQTRKELQKLKQESFKEFVSKISQLDPAKHAGLFGLISTGLSELKLEPTAEGQRILESLLKLDKDVYIQSAEKEKTMPRDPKLTHKIEITGANVGKGMKAELTKVFKESAAEIKKANTMIDNESDILANHASAKIEKVPGK